MAQLDLFHLSEEMHAVFARDRAAAQRMHADLMPALPRLSLSSVNDVVVVCMYTEKDWKKQVNCAIVLIPLILRALMIK